MRRSLLLVATVSVPLALSPFWGDAGAGQPGPVQGPSAAALGEQPGGQKDHPDGAESQALYRGTETLVVSFPPAKGKPRLAAGWDLPEGFHIHNYASSQDGQRLWLVLLNASVKGNPWQIWSLKTDGSDPKQAAFAPDKLPGAPIAYTNRDGTIAWLFASPGYDFYHVYQIRLGGAARLVTDSKNLEGMKNGEFPQVTADGKSLFYLARNLGVVQLREDGSAKLVQAKKEIVHEGASMADDRLWNLAINADGSQWAATSRLGGLKGAPSVVVRSTPRGIRLHIDTTPTLTQWGIFVRVNMSADGETVLFERSGTPRDGQLFLWRGDQVKPLKADVAETDYGFLSGDGKTLYAAGGPTGFLEDLATGKRHRVMTSAIAALPRTYSGNHRLSRDGLVLTTLYPTGETGLHGLYVFQVGNARPEYPNINSVRQRYDGEKLIVTIAAETKDSPRRVFALGLKNGYLNPALLLKEADNPLHEPLWFGAINLTPDAKRPGVYQIIVNVGKKRALLDDSYSLRLVVLDAAGNRATFVDVPVLR